MNSATEVKQMARLDLGDQQLDLPLVVGSENERAFDIQTLRNETGVISLDEGYRNTAAVKSEITFIDGEQGILRYRGIPIEQLAEKSTFNETSLLLINGELPSHDELERFKASLTEHQMIHEGMRNSFLGFPPNANPMAIISAMINTLFCYSEEAMLDDAEHSFEIAAARIISKIRTVAAYAYKTSIGQPIIYPDPDLSYCRNFLHMMFSLPNKRYEPSDIVSRALTEFLILHADHEQNCSTSTVRMVGSSGANLFASCAAGVCALWGPLHGGANVAVMEQLEMIHKSGQTVESLIEDVKQKKTRLSGFGHGVYRSYDPRAQLLRKRVPQVLEHLGLNDPMLNIARELEETALNDDYFVSRNLYPNVDFYSGILLRALGIPTNMYTVMFAMGRLPGWIAHWKEVRDTNSRIYRPRQIYTGPTKRDYVAVKER